MKITSEFLRDRNACGYQADIFEAEWPDGAELTLANLLRGVDLGLDVNWLGRHLRVSCDNPPFLAARKRVWDKYADDTRPLYEAHEATLPGGIAADDAFLDALAPHMVVADKAMCYAIMEALGGGT